MEFKDYYQTLGLARDASADDVKLAYRKLARKYHPDVSKEPDAEARFKDIGEANEVLKDPEKRAAYDAASAQWERQRAAGGSGGRAGGFEPPPGWNAGFEFSGGDGEDPLGGMDHSDFFEALFGRPRRGANPRAREAGMRGQDHHAKVQIAVEDAYRGAHRSIVLRLPEFDDAGRGVMRERTLDVNIPKGIRAGQHLRLAGQGGPGLGNAPAGDLFLEIEFEPHARFRVDGRDVYVDLPLAPWEAALGAPVSVTTPDGELELTIPPNSAAGRKLRLKGKGLPGSGANPAGDLYAVVTIALPPATSERARNAYVAFGAAFDFNPRASAST